MQDVFGRNITYLRLSVTDKCNLRCRYCMPSEGICSIEHEKILTQEEMIMAVKASSSLGIRKVRITGGEPLVKKNILSIVEGISQLEGIDNISMTTNGTLLSSFAADLKKAGLRNINISLDTLNSEKYRTITRIGTLDDALSGLESVLSAGFEKIKINSVLMGGFNDDEIGKLSSLTLKYPVDVRFIELMPMTEDEFFSPGFFISNRKVLEALPTLERVGSDDSVAKLYRLPGAKGNIGLISPLSDHFCFSCNRLRLTADGHIKPCLHSRLEYPIKGLDYQGMVEMFKKAILSKPQKHNALSYDERSEAGRYMNTIGG